MISIFKRGKKWYIQYQLLDKQVQKSTGLDATSENKKLIKSQIIPKLQSKIDKGEISQDKPKKFKYYSSLYIKSKENIKSYKEYRGILKNKIEPFLADRVVKTISRKDIREIANHYLKTLSPKRVRIFMNMIGAIMELALEDEEILANPSTNIKLPRHETKRQDPFTSQEVNKIINNASGWFKNYLAIAFYTGARNGEIIALTWQDVDIGNMTININKRIKKGEINAPKTKSSIRIVPIVSELVKYIKNQKQYSSGKYIFTNSFGRKIHDANKLLPTWYQLLDKIGLEKRVLYITRHTFITQMMRNTNASMLDIAQMVGHKNTDMIINTYARYIKDSYSLPKNLSLFTDTMPQSTTI